MEKTLLKRKLKEKSFIFVLVIWPIIHFCIFWVYINFGTILKTFQQFDYNTLSDKFVGLENYVEAFEKMVLGKKDPAMQRAFFNSFQAIGINLVIMPIAIFSAYAFYKKMPGTKFYSVMFYIPQLVSIIVLTTVFRSMFSSKFGPISKLFGIDFLSKDNAFYLWMVIWLYCIWSGLGSNVILMRGAMLKIPKEVTESAILDGCGFFREMWSIAIPLSMSTISVFLLTTSMSAASFTMPPMLIAQYPGDRGEFMTISWHIFNNAGSKLSIYSTTTFGILFTLLTTPLVLLTKFLTKKFTPEI